MKAWLVLYQLGFFRVAEQGAERAVVSAGADDMGWRGAGGLSFLCTI